MDAQRSYLLNAWYVAALSTEVNADTMLSCKLLGMSVVLFRDEDGTAMAMHDRCPHRFVPLSMGKKEGGEIPWTQTPPSLILNQFLHRPEEEARHWIKVSWTVPSTIQLSLYCAQDDTPVHNEPGQYDLHSAIPEDEHSTHYFFCSRRNHIEGDADYSAFKIQAMHDAFEQEDGVLIAATEAEMGGGDFFDLGPMLLSNDFAAVKVRRRLRDLVAQELAG